MKQRNPFEYEKYGRRVQAIDADSRIRMAQGFDAEQLRDAIALSGVQKRVKSAAERRLRQLESGK